MRVVVDAGLLEGGMTAKEAAPVIGRILHGIVIANVAYLRRNPHIPHPYKAGIRYQREPRGQEHWKGIAQTLRDGHGDCEDLASYLAAWYRARGQKAQIHIVWKRSRRGGRLFHIQVRGPSGRIEDPSRVLGM